MMMEVPPVGRHELQRLRRNDLLPGKRFWLGMVDNFDPAEIRLATTSEGLVGLDCCRLNQKRFSRLRR